MPESLTGIVPEDTAKGLWDSIKNITASSIFNAVLVAAACLVAMKLNGLWAAPSWTRP